MLGSQLSHVANLPVPSFCITVVPFTWPFISMVNDWRPTDWQSSVERIRKKEWWRGNVMPYCVMMEKMHIYKSPCHHHGCLWLFILSHTYTNTVYKVEFWNSLPPVSTFVGRQLPRILWWPLCLCTQGRTPLRPLRRMHTFVSNQLLLSFPWDSVIHQWMKTAAPLPTVVWLIFADAVGLWFYNSQ